MFDLQIVEGLFFIQIYLYLHTYAYFVCVYICFVYIYYTYIIYIYLMLKMAPLNVIIPGVIELPPTVKTIQQHKMFVIDLYLYMVVYKL